MKAHEAYEIWIKKTDEARVYMGLPRLTLSERVMLMAPFLCGVLAALDDPIERDSVHEMVRREFEPMRLDDLSRETQDVFGFYGLLLEAWGL